MLSAQTTDPAGRIKEARKLNTEGKHDEALALYRDALQHAPDSFDAHFGAGVALDLKGEYADARIHFARAIELAPEGSKDEARPSSATSSASPRTATAGGA